MKLESEPVMKLHVPEWRQLQLVLVGCGGTGSHLASGLVVIAQELERRGKVVDITFIDGDTVEEKNVGRQLFAPADVGRNKAEVLSERMLVAFGKAVAVVPAMLDAKTKVATGDMRDRVLTVYVGAVDNAGARDAIDDRITTWNQSPWWLDCGNSYVSGQVGLGNSRNPRDLEGAAGLGMISRLPAPSLIWPDLVKPTQPQKLKAKAKPRARLSCAELAAAGEQGLIVNRMVAAHALAMLDHWLVRDDLKYFGVNFNLEWGTSTSLVIDAATIKRTCGADILSKTKGKGR